MTEAETFSWPCSRQLGAQLAAIRPFKRGGEKKEGEEGKREKREEKERRKEERRKKEEN